jgi:hypothetical protein
VEKTGTFIEKQAGARVLVLPSGGEAPTEGVVGSAHDRALQEDRSTPSNMLPWWAQLFICAVAARPKAAGCAWRMGMCCRDDARSFSNGRPAGIDALLERKTDDPSTAQLRATNLRCARPRASNRAPVGSTSERSWVALFGLDLLGRALPDRPAFRALVRRPLRHEPAHRLQVVLVYRSNSPRLPILHARSSPIRNPPIRVCHGHQRASIDPHFRPHSSVSLTIANTSVLRRRALPTPASIIHHGYGLLERSRPDQASILQRVLSPLRAAPTAAVAAAGRHPA